MTVILWFLCVFRKNKLNYASVHLPVRWSDNNRPEKGINGFYYYYYCGLAPGKVEVKDS